MGSFITAHAYLGFSVLLLAAAGGLALVLRGRWRSLALAGAVAAPAGLLDIFFIPSYWDPVTVLGTRIGPEDLVFSLAVGVISCGLAFGGAAAGETTVPPTSVAAGRLAGMAAGYVIWMVVVTLATDLPVMDAAVLGVLVVGGVLLWRNPALLWSALRGAALFGVLYVLALRGAFELWPDFPSQWSPSAVSGVRVLSVPSGEIVWAFAYGAVYPLVFASVTALRSSAEASPPVRPRCGPLLDGEAERLS